MYFFLQWSQPSLWMNFLPLQQLAQFLWHTLQLAEGVALPLHEAEAEVELARAEVAWV